MKDSKNVKCPRVRKEGRKKMPRFTRFRDLLEEEIPYLFSCFKIFLETWMLAIDVFASFRYNTFVKEHTQK